MPYCVSKIHCQMTVLANAGIDQASIRPRLTSRRIFPPSRLRSRAMAMPSAIVSATLTAQKATVRRSTAQNSGSSKIVR
jgi:hypothetical protein